MTSYLVLGQSSEWKLNVRDVRGYNAVLEFHHPGDCTGGPTYSELGVAQWTAPHRNQRGVLNPQLDRAGENTASQNHNVSAQTTEYMCTQQQNTTQTAIRIEQQQEKCGTLRSMSTALNGCTQWCCGGHCRVPSTVNGPLRPPTAACLLSAQAKPTQGIEEPKAADTCGSQPKQTHKQSTQENNPDQQQNWHR